MRLTGAADVEGSPMMIRRFLPMTVTRIHRVAHLPRRDRLEHDFAEAGRAQLAMPSGKLGNQRNPLSARADRSNPRSAGPDGVLRPEGRSRQRERLHWRRANGTNPFRKYSRGNVQVPSNLLGIFGWNKSDVSAARAARIDRRRSISFSAPLEVRMSSCDQQSRRADEQI